MRPLRLIAVVLLCCVETLSYAQATTPGIAAKALQPYLDDHMVAGVVTLVATPGKILDLEAMGYADIAKKRPMQTGDVFWIASMSKAMTASAIMMLVDEGKLSVDDPVEKYIPEFKGQMVRAGKDSDKLEPSARPFTIRQILSHTAGLPYMSKPENGLIDRLPLKDAVATYAAEPRLTQPGTAYSYSNEGFNIAGRIVELVSGMPYETFMQTRLFDPLGMKDTTFWPTPAEIARLATSYKPDAAKQDLVETTIAQLTYPLDDRRHRFPAPAGGLFATATDTSRFCLMILNDGVFAGKRILSKAAIDAMTTRQTPTGIDPSYGFGLFAPPEIIHHQGAYKTEMAIDREHGVVVVLMVQQGGIGWKTKEGDQMLVKLEHLAANMAH